MIDLTEKQCVDITQHALAILQSWGLSDSDIVELAGLSGSIKGRHLDRYKRGQPLPNEKDVYIRLEHVLGIDEALGTTYPRNEQMARIWLNRPHRRFGKKTPMELIMTGGAKGLLAVRMDLDCTFSWDKSISGSSN